MKRTRITERFPFLRPLRLYQKRVFYNIKLHMDKNSYAHTKGDTLKETICSSTTNIINENSGYDIKYQFQKEHNLTLIKECLDGLVIKPYETFSFIYSTKSAEKNDTFQEGLVVIDGKIIPQLGGGICQMSSQLYALFLESPLTIIERHSHQTDYFKPHDISNINGMDATIHHGWKDLKVKNCTINSFQIKVDIDNHKLKISLRSTYKSNLKYILSNSNIKLSQKNHQTYKSFDVIRSVYDLNNPHYFRTEIISSDTLELCYPT